MYISYSPSEGAAVIQGWPLTRVLLTTEIWEVWRLNKQQGFGGRRGVLTSMTGTEWPHGRPMVPPIILYYMHLILACGINPNSQGGCYSNLSRPPPLPKSAPASHIHERFSSNLMAEFFSVEVMDPLNILHFHFRWVLKLLTSHRSHCSQPVHICDSNHTHCLMSLQ